MGHITANFKMEKKVIVGCGVFIIKEGKILLGKRQKGSSHGSGTWCLPGGSLEFGETFDEFAKRETKEECGLEIGLMSQVAVTNNIFKDEDIHSITLFFSTNWIKGEPLVNEPDKIAQWNWFSWDNLPEPLFLPLELLKKQNFNPLLEKNPKE